jgi:hypothetical protein
MEIVQRIWANLAPLMHQGRFYGHSTIVVLA